MAPSFGRRLYGRRQEGLSAITICRGSSAIIYERPFPSFGWKGWIGEEGRIMPVCCAAVNLPASSHHHSLQKKGEVRVKGPFGAHPNALLPLSPFKERSRSFFRKEEGGIR
jgi:hypothetical protein